jgi:hypothetical protein
MPSYEPVVPKGQHLGTSRNVEDAVTGHLFEDGTKEPKGHAAWRLVDEPKEDYSSSYDYEAPRQLTQEEMERAAELAALMIYGIVKAVVVVTPYVVRWWKEKAAPTAKSAWKRATARRKANSQVAPVSDSSVSRARFVVSSTGVELAVAESKIRMSGAEWEQRFRAVLAAGAFKEEQQRILSNAQIEDDRTALETQSIAEQLTPQQFADRIQLMLEANPSLLDDATSAELMRVFSLQLKPSTDPPELEQ